MSILDKVVALNELESKSVKIILGEIGAGKTSFHKDMPDVAGGDILYLAIGNDKGFNQLKADTRFKTLSSGPIKTFYVEKNSKKIAIKKRVLSQLTEILEAFKNEEHNFAGLAIDAISTIQEAIEMEIRFDKNKNLDWDDWSSIKKGMFRVYELCEEIAEQGYEVSLQTHFQIREYEDAYSGDKTTRLLPLMTENNAIRVLKNADAVVMIKVMPDGKDRKIVHRMSIVGGHSTIPTKIRNEHNLSFDGILFKDLTYGGLVKLMQIESLDEAADLDGVTLRKEESKTKRKKLRKSKQDKADEDIDDSDDTKEIEVSNKPAKVKSKKSKKEPKVEEPSTTKAKSKNKSKKKHKVVEDEDVVEVKTKTKSKTKAKKEKAEPEEVAESSSRKKPAKKHKPAKIKKAKSDKKDKLGKDNELKNVELFDED